MLLLVVISLSLWLLLLFLLTVVVHLTIHIVSIVHHAFSVLFVFFLAVHVLHGIFVFLEAFYLLLLMTFALRHLAVFLLVDEHVLLVGLHLHQKLLVLFFVQFVHVFLAFAFVFHFIFLVLGSVLSSLGSHKLLDLLVSFFDIGVVTVLSIIFCATWRLFLILLLTEHLLL